MKEDPVATAEQKWSTLLEWLSEKGAETNSFKATLHLDKLGYRGLVATEDISEGVPILSIPGSALLNSSTLPNRLKKEIDRQGWSSVQALSLFLAENRPGRKSPDLQDQDYYFAPFVASLPTEFPSVPLTWILENLLGDLSKIIVSDTRVLSQFESNVRDQKHEGLHGRAKLLRMVTTSMANVCHEVTKRFIEDWKALVASQLEASHPINLDELLWGWLNVNTRCLWFDLGCKRYIDNITLAPGLDMANHAVQSSVAPVATPHTLTIFSSHPRGPFASPRSKTLLSSSKPTVRTKASSTVIHKKGDEIVFSYGPHGNATLWAEYGFVLNSSNPWDSIEITTIIDNLFKAEEMAEKYMILRDSAYWRDYTIQSEPLGPSYRTLVALRLLHHPTDKLNEWYQHIQGHVNDLGPETEARVNETLRTVYKELCRKARSALNRIDSGSDYVYERYCLRIIVSEELRILTDCCRLPFQC
ncbi:hypothetical protein CROQUDRAFT_43866 [Cronartium quercuum f. sp. fusiforme G11]|uniref:SET domain-containing protein n=1 Tax=Cronartium quercuum f. sp. fusiforme G11 TaxID=708437 RepID=A0A9P6NH05_9BASI|nr:hypothetical protein CROQUDRAFT_43866 [Cronartium quercuum f. sp. fusiforme G11]